ncbi:hypothetical protein D3C79_911290 [compost metagenome]
MAVGHVDQHLGHGIQRAAGGFQRVTQVVQCLAGLRLDAASNHLALCVDGDLGGVQRTVANYRPFQGGPGGEQLCLDCMFHTLVS